MVLPSTFREEWCILLHERSLGLEGGPKMASTTEAGMTLDFPEGEGRILVHGVDWDDYKKMLQIVGDRHIHVTYDEGTMEVRMPSQRHEQAAQLLGFFVPHVADELEVDYEPLGMTT
jgi:hypothetical protein